MLKYSLRGISGMRTIKINVPNPYSEQVEHYLRAWDELEK